MRSMLSVGLLHDQLRPDVDGGELPPALVDLLDVDGVVDVHELEQVEQEQAARRRTPRR